MRSESEMAARLPTKVREDVARAILGRAVDLHWEELTFQERSAAYSDWVLDPAIGGVIAEYVPADRIRLWIKDGPIKEYQRARRGQGSYAKLLPGAEGLEKRIVDSVLGGKWSVKDGSVKVKPSRFIAVDLHDDEISVTWGTVVELKHVVWHWLRSPLVGNSVLVVLAVPQHPITDDIKITISRLRKRLDVPVEVVSL